MASASTIMQRCDELAACSEDPLCLTRRFASVAMQAAHQRVRGWMQEAGMDVRTDNIGNLIGRYDGASANAPTLLLGSHLDSVRDAGRYDGPLGVLMGLAAVEHLHASGQRLPFALEVVGFADEEGVRYHSSYLGSSALCGTFAPEYLDLADADGISMAEAIRRFGGDPTAIANDRHAPDLLGYLEVHIEQGPVLEAEDLPVGVVTAIQGQSRFALTFGGMAGHAGTVPMLHRRDALCAAAELVLFAERLALTTDGLVATVGQMQVLPGASNVIPGVVSLSLDVRHQNNATREHACDLLRAEAERISNLRQVVCGWQPVQSHGAVPCDPVLAALLAQSIAAAGVPVRHLASGAGHDAAILAQICPAAMLFVRCAGGISHNPAESVQEADVAVALAVLNDTIARLASQVASRT